MVINDKLKGDYYRAPITKLASRRNVETTINELIDYYNNLAVNLDKCFDKISTERVTMIESLGKIYAKTIHFKYIIDHFELEVDQHILEKLNLAISTFQSNLTSILTPYEENLFNHAASTDTRIAVGNQTSLEEWDRSINSLSTDLGIRWFGGKIDNKELINRINGLLRITKVNTFDGSKNEDYVNSNLILEIFVYTLNGMAWLTLGQNSTFGYNLVTKYISDKMKMNMSLVAENYNVNKEFDLNTFDFDMILNTLLTSNDLKKGNVYIKVKTNIPSNSESGKESYFISDNSNFTDYEYKKALKDFSTGMLYHDNKDIMYLKHDSDNIVDIDSKNYPKTETPNLINPSSKEFYDINHSTNEKMYTSKINIINKNNITQEIYNVNNDVMKDLSDIICGITISNSNVKTSSKYFDKGITFNKGVNEEDIIYEKGNNLVNLNDIKNIGIENTLINKNEMMFAIDNISSKKSVIPFSARYGTELAKKTILNNVTNNETISIVNDTNMMETIPNYITQPLSQDGEYVLAVCHVNENWTIISKSDGVYRIHDNTKLNGNYPASKITLTNNATIVYDIAVDNIGNIIFATDHGILKYNLEENNTSTFGITSGSWDRLFLSTNKKYLIAISQGFSTSTDNNIITYGDSICCEKANYTEMMLISDFTNNDSSYYTLDNADISDAFKKNIDVPNFDRVWQKEFNVIVDYVNHKYYIFRYGNKMLVSDRAYDDEITNFGNFKLVAAMSQYALTSAVLDNNKIYFTVFNGGNYVYDISSDTVSPVTYTTTKVYNNRNEYERIYYLDDISDLAAQQREEPQTVSPSFVKKLNDKIVFIPLEGNIRNIVYVNGYYYVLYRQTLQDQTISSYIQKFDNNFETKNLIIYNNTIIMNDLNTVENYLLIICERFVGSDNESKLFYECLAEVETNPVKIICNSKNK
jgi:hypothetical protein